ncbi:MULTISPECIES: maleylpyruvate isomerase N-terminal domain-containing protein [unclassified Crossiella]|uniref:maleylpyruvate isomerase N-terminal domain-containing protein n=1 Tax=unclassified Crossiella TaxID=2620835 RepID=UPI001FFF2B78|nr:MULTISPECIES: maleylpyruvate isomerase N-terminal domain-containing protein [unclassified Crossiella]MCK2242837.1 maleylpyruvate isomerase N-terminal domain-containing protein [Crossiella sp. S99.2]MCK2256714.1 maleylpyruvate isomerase N-terminal domain-containing protein [Crossiella sp. S99.1]
MLNTRSDFLATARVAAQLLRHPALAGSWDKPSALPEFSVAGLAGHLAFQVTALPTILAGPIPPELPISLPEHYNRVEWVDADLDHELNVRIRDSGEAAAANGPAALADSVDAALTTLTETLPDLPERTVRIQFWGPWSLSLEDMLVTRMMELTVHSDDLAVSLGVPTPDFPPAAVEAVVDLLSRLALRRHGAPAVLRALTRAERAPASVTAF